MTSCENLRLRIASFPPTAVRLPAESHADIVAGRRTVCPYSDEGRHIVHLLNEYEKRRARTDHTGFGAIA